MACEVIAPISRPAMAILANPPMLANRDFAGGDTLAATRCQIPLPANTDVKIKENMILKNQEGATMS